MAEANVTTTKPLPAEVLTKIFEHCRRPNLTELVNIVDVCQLARDVAIHEYNRSGNDLVIRHPDDINDLVSLLCKPVSFTKLHVVWDVPKDVDCSSVSLDALADTSSLTHLQSFSFDLKDDNNNEHQRVLLALILQTSADTLTHFKLMNHARFDSSMKVVVALLEACQHLSHLVLNGCELYYEEMERLLDIIPTLTHLHLLDLRGTYRGDPPLNLSFIEDVKRGCPNISNNIMIRRLCIEPSDDVSMLQFLSHVGRLEIEEFNTEQLGSLMSCLNARASLLSVDTLDVSMCCDHLTDDILLSLVQRLRGVKYVGARGCGQLTNEGAVSVITSVPQLEEINIGCIRNMSTDIIQLLARVATENNVCIEAYGTGLSDEMKNSPDDKLYTGTNGNICLRYRFVSSFSYTE